MKTFFSEWKGTLSRGKCGMFLGSFFPLVDIFTTLAWFASCSSISYSPSKSPNMSVTCSSTPYSMTLGAYFFSFIYFLDFFLLFFSILFFFFLTVVNFLFFFLQATKEDKITSYSNISFPFLEDFLTKGTTWKMSLLTYLLTPSFTHSLTSLLTS